MYSGVYIFTTKYFNYINSRWVISYPFYREGKTEAGQRQ